MWCGVKGKADKDRCVLQRHRSPSHGQYAVIRRLFCCIRDGEGEAKAIKSVPTAILHYSPPQVACRSAAAPSVAYFSTAAIMLTCNASCLEGILGRGAGEGCCCCCLAADTDSSLASTHILAASIAETSACVIR